ncbi:MAG: hypothetical protein FD180_3020 [Planctomycetota bacterium]|nr:MAG: hypothetical protein FD180_3020 [Planctomycetota bacterium]
MRFRELAAVATCALAVAAETLRLPVTADTSICIAESERANNAGAKSHLRVKGIEHILLIDVDAAKLRGKTVEEARLWMRASNEVRLKTMGVSSVSTAWGEGKGADAPAAKGESCFLQAARNERDWAGPGSDFLGAAFGAGGSVWEAVEIREEKDGWLSIPLPPRILHAMAEGNSFGFAVSDEKGQTRANNDVYSREQNASAPYVLVEKWKDAPAPVSGAAKFVARAPEAVADRSQEILKLIPTLPDSSESKARYRIVLEGEWKSDAPAARRLWDGKRIELHAARGEHVAFEVALEVEGLVEGNGWTVTQVLPVGAAADPLVPAGKGPGLFHVERHVPKDSAPGEQSLEISIAGSLVPVTLHVHRAVLPDALNFHVSLNTYSSPGGTLGDRSGSKDFIELEFAFHRMAHEHRATIAVVPYSHHGDVEDGFAPALKNGKIASWKAWDARWKPYFDGSAFSGLPRDSAPIDHFYMPFSENWPLPILENYKWKGALEDHWREAPAVEEAFPKAYADAFRAAVADAARHLSAWKGTSFQVYFNDKNNYWKAGRNSCWWLLDEPAYRDDFLALRYFGSLTKQGLALVPGSPVTFRLDLSRPQWRRGHLDGLVGLDVISGVYREYPQFVFDRQEAVWTYGSVPAPGANGQSARAWCLQAFLDGCDGVVPWQTIGRQDSWKTPEDTALILPARPGLPRAPYATLRLKMLRRGAQDVELLRLWLEKSKASRAEIRAGLASNLGLAGTFRKSSEEDAGRIDFGKLDAEKFEGMRRALLEALDGE